MRIAEMRVYLRISSRFMKLAKEAFFEDRPSRLGRWSRNRFWLFDRRFWFLRETLLNRRLTKLEENLLTFAFDLVDSLGPNLAINALSTAFLTSRGAAQRSSGEFLSALTTGPRPVHPAMSFEATWASTKEYNSSGAMLKSRRIVINRR